MFQKIILNLKDYAYPKETELYFCFDEKNKTKILKPRDTILWIIKLIVATETRIFGNILIDEPTFPFSFWGDIKLYGSIYK